MSEKHLIVFVCTGNTCRSPMAAALFNKLNTRPEWSAVSCGLAAFGGEPATLEARQTLFVDFGISLESHRARPATAECLKDADLILTMTTSHRLSLLQVMPELGGRIFTIGEKAGRPDLSIPDPFGQDLPVYRQTATLLASLIEKIIAGLPESSDTAERQSGFPEL